MLRLLREAEEEKAQIEPIPNITDLEKVDENTEMIKKAYQEAVNDVIQNAWDFISNINSLITTLDYDYKEDNKEELVGILNTSVDDATVIVGMLHSVLDIIDPKTTQLIKDGSEKAETLVNNV